MMRDFILKYKVTVIAVLIMMIPVAAGSFIGYQCGEKAGYEQCVADKADSEVAEKEVEEAPVVVPEVLEEPEAISETYTVTTETDPLTLREYADQAAKSLGKVPRGTVVQITDKDGTWGYTSYDGESGWINMAYCTEGEVEVAPVEEPKTTEDNISVTVYVTKTGECYHKDGCYHLRQSKIPISLVDATDQNYRPCSHCNPPVLDE